MTARTAEPLGAVSRSRGTVHLERTIAATLDRVWAAWTDPSVMGEWFAPVDGVPGPGATFVLRMTADESATCTVQAWDPPRLFELTWDYTGEGASRLRVELSESDGGGTRLVLDHDRLFDADPAGYGAGWHAELELLQAHLDGRPKPQFTPRYEQLLPLYEAAANST